MPLLLILIGISLLIVGVALQQLLTAAVGILFLALGFRLERRQ